MSDFSTLISELIPGGGIGFSIGIFELVGAATPPPSRFYSGCSAPGIIEYC
jgi:hypothetical protein